MCRFHGSQHGNYTPCRSNSLFNRQRLGTIFEASQDEIAREKCNEVEKGLERLSLNERQPLLEDKVKSPPSTKSKTSNTMKQRYKFISRFQQSQDEWRQFLTTPYADFFPEKIGASMIDVGFYSPSYAVNEKIQRIKSIKKEDELHRSSEIAAWLEFFG